MSVKYVGTPDLVGPWAPLPESTDDYAAAHIFYRAGRVTDTARSPRGVIRRGRPDRSRAGFQTFVLNQRLEMCRSVMATRGRSLPSARRRAR